MRQMSEFTGYTRFLQYEFLWVCHTNTKPSWVSMGFLYNGEQSSLGLLRSKPSLITSHHISHTIDSTLSRSLRLGSDSRWMQRSITSLVTLRWEGSSAFTSGPPRSSTSSHSVGGGTSGQTVMVKYIIYEWSTRLLLYNSLLEFALYSIFFHYNPVLLLLSWI